MRALVIILVLLLVAQPALGKRFDLADGAKVHPDFVPPGQAKKTAVEPAQASEDPQIPPPVADGFAPPAPAAPAPIPVPASNPSAPAPTEAPHADAEASPTGQEPTAQPAAPPPALDVAAPVERHDPPATLNFAAPLEHHDSPPAPDIQAPAPKAHVQVPTADGVTLWPGTGLAMGALLGATAAGWGVRAVYTRRRRRDPSPQPGPRPPEAINPLEALLRRAEGNPFDGEARFQLGIELLGRGRETEALRYLVQAFRYHPQAILQVLKDPQLAYVRENAGVRLILKRFQRETSRRLWTGYT